MNCEIIFKIYFNHKYRIILNNFILKYKYNYTNVKYVFNINKHKYKNRII